MRRELAGFVASARRRGVAVTLRLLASELGFDLRHRTRTHPVLEGVQLGALPERLHGRQLVYHPINPLVMRRTLAVLRRLDGEAAWAGSFVDFGCGSGRALILAARHGFHTVIGVECSATLADACERNLAASWRRLGLRASRELRRVDAAEFVVPDDSTLWLWFNPFDARDARLVGERMLESLRRRPRVAYLAYAHPEQLGALLELGFVAVAEVRVAPGHRDAVILRAGERACAPTSLPRTPAPSYPGACD